jgi:excisionase family DNA binding protein
VTKEDAPKLVEFPGWISTAQAAEILGCTPRYVNRLVQFGVLSAPAKLYGWLLMFKKEDIEAYRDSHPRLGTQHNRKGSGNEPESLQQ